MKRPPKGLCTQCSTLQRLLSHTCDECTRANASARIDAAVTGDALVDLVALLREAGKALDLLDAKGKNNALIDRIETAVGGKL